LTKQLPIGLAASYASMSLEVAAKRLELLWIGEGAVHVDARQVHGAGGQLKGVAGIFGSTVEQHTPTLAEHPESDITFGGSCVDLRSQH
jgi:hypothetical protein